MRWKLRGRARLRTISAGVSLSGDVSTSAAPDFTSAPVILGNPTVGIPISYLPGTVTGSPTPSVTRQWLLDGSDISGATNTTYTPVSGDIGTGRLSVRETATNSAGSDSSTSAARDVLAEGATITSFTLTSAAASGTYPFTVGLPLAEGQATSIATDLATSQVTIAATWPDGSIRNAFISGRAAMAPSAVVTVSAGTPVSGAALTRGDIPAGATSGGAYTVDCGAFGSVTFDIVSGALDATWPTWISGAEMSEWHQVAAIGSSGMLAWQYTRLYADGRVQCKQIIENPTFDNGSGGATSNVNRTFAPVFTVNGTAVWSGPSQTVSKGVSIQATGASDGWFWVNGTDPQISVTHDAAHWRQTRVVPNTGWNSPSSGSLNALQQTYTAGSNGPINADMSDTGAQPQIGLYPEWDAFFIASGDPRAYLAVLAGASSSRSYAICVRAATTKHIPRPSQFSTWGNDNPDGFTPGGGGWYQTSTGSLIWDVAHHHSAGTLAYLLTGDRWHYDTMGLQAAICYLVPGNTGSGTSRDLRNQQLRGLAWMFRTLGQYAAFARTEDLAAGRPGGEYRTLLSTNYDLLNTTRVTGTTYSWTGLLYYLGPPGLWNTVGSLPLWQGDFFSMVHGLVGHLKPLASMTNQNLVRDHAYKLQVGRLGLSGVHQDFDFTRAAAYGTTIFTDDTGAVAYQSWGELHAANYGGNTLTTNARQGESGADPANMVGDNYWAILNAAIAYAVEDGAQGAADAYLRLTGSTNWAANADSAWSNYPKWAFVPRITAVATALPYTPATTVNTSVTFLSNAATDAGNRASTHTASEWENAIFNSYSGRCYVKSYSYPCGGIPHATPGGHNNSGMYDQAVVDLSLGAWVRVPNTNGAGGTTYTASSYSGSGFPVEDATADAYMEIIAGTGANPLTRALPSPSHQFGHMQGLERGAKGASFIVGCSGRTEDSNESPTIHRGDLATGLFTRALTGTYAGIGFVGGSAFDPTRNRYYITKFDNSQSVIAYLQVNPTSMSLSSINLGSEPSQQGGDYWSSFVYDSANLLMRIHGGHLMYTDLTNPGAGMGLCTVTGTIPNGSGIVWTWHPVKRAFYARINQTGNLLHKLTPPASSPKTNAWVVTTETIGGAGLPAWNYDGGSNNQNYNGLQYCGFTDNMIHVAGPAANQTVSIKL